MAAMQGYEGASVTKLQYGSIVTLQLTITIYSRMNG